MCLSNDVVICIATYKRKEELRNLLKSISVSKGIDVSSLSVVVADNAPELGMAKYVSDNGFFDFDLTVIEVSEKGISYVRNALMNHAIRLKRKYLLFVDDDEYVHENWIYEITSSALRYNADIVSAPVEPIFIQEPPEWIIQGGYFNRRRFSTGEYPGTTRCGNILINLDFVKDEYKCKEFFDLELANTGGEDSLFIEKLHILGARHVWCDEAIVYEIQNPKRINETWLLNRFFQIGYAGVKYRSKIYPANKYKLLRCFKTVYLLFKFLCIILSLRKSNRIFEAKAVLYEFLGRIKCQLGKKHESY